MIDHHVEALARDLATRVTTATCEAAAQLVRQAMAGEALAANLQLPEGVVLSTGAERESLARLVRAVAPPDASAVAAWAWAKDERLFADGAMSRPFTALRALVEQAIAEAQAEPALPDVDAVRAAIRPMDA